MFLESKRGINSVIFLMKLTMTVFVWLKNDFYFSATDFIVTIT